MFVRRQNCAIMIHMPAKESVNVDETTNVIVSVFPGSLKPRKIYEHSGDIEVNILKLPKGLRQLPVTFCEFSQFSVTFRNFLFRN